MKAILTLITLIFVSISCKSQSIVVPIENGYEYSNNPNYYIKDVNNEFDKFEGTWKFYDGNREIILKLRKEIQYQLSDEHCYEDLLVGEYKYVINNIIVVNTLNYFNSPLIEGYGHNISGGSFLYRLPDYCIDNSQPSEIKISLFISDPNDDDLLGSLILRYLIDNGTEKIQACFYDESTLSFDSNDSIAIPDGYYEFIKQE